MVYLLQNCVEGSRNFIPSVSTGDKNLPTTGQVLATDKRYPKTSVEFEILQSFCPRFSTLLTALGAAFGEETGLSAPFTVFAPTNSAFAKLGNETIINLLGDTDALQQGEHDTSSLLCIM